MRALLLIYLLSWLAACGGIEPVIPDPVVVEIVRVERVPVPVDLLTQRPKTVIPEVLTYGEAIEAWAEDRASLDIQNAKLREIANAN